jgi:hypothetical protein
MIEVTAVVAKHRQMMMIADCKPGAPGLMNDGALEKSLLVKWMNPHDRFHLDHRRNSDPDPDHHHLFHRPCYHETRSDFVASLLV